MRCFHLDGDFIPRMSENHDEGQRPRSPRVFPQAGNILHGRVSTVDSTDLIGHRNRLLSSRRSFISSLGSTTTHPIPSGRSGGGLNSMNFLDMGSVRSMVTVHFSLSGKRISTVTCFRFIFPSLITIISTFPLCHFTSSIHKSFWKNLTSSLSETVQTTAMVFLILIGAHIFGYFLTISQIPDQLSILATEAELNRNIVLTLLVLAYIILGCFMEGLAIMVLTIPIVFPMVLDMGFDPVWFGVIITLVMEMSLITPPVGINVFIISGITKEVPMYTIFRGVIPFWFAMLACIILITVFPQIALYLPLTMTQ